MNKSIPYAIVTNFIVFFLVLASSASGQISVTFKLNLKPQMKDSVYVPGRDQVYLKGNVFPLTDTKKVYLTDVAPKDSIFQTTVDFPPNASHQKLKYNYFIQTPIKLMDEQLPRYLRLRKKDVKLDALYFNSFAW